MRCRLTLAIAIAAAAVAAGNDGSEHENRIRWRIATRDTADSVPAMCNDVVYFSDRSGRIYAVDAATGKTCWVHNDKEIRIRGGERSPSPVASEKLVYYASDYHLYALDAKSGDITWKRRTTGTVATPVLFSDLLYFGSRPDGYLNKGYLNAINANNGTEVWKRKITGHITCTPVIAGDTLLFGSSAGLLYAMNLKTNRELWKTNTGDPPIGTPTTNNKIICVVLPGFPDSANLKAFNLKTGKLIWGPKGPLIWDHASPVITGNMVCFGGIMGGLIAHNSNTGKIVWHFMPFGKNTHGISNICNTPAVFKDTIYMGFSYHTDYALYAVDSETGKAKWKYPLEVPIRGPLLLKEGVMYFGAAMPEKYYFYAVNCNE